MNTDGKLDIIMCAYNNIYIFENTDAFESAPTDYTEIELPTPEYFQIADFDNDGLPDIAVAAKGSGTSLSFKLYISKNNGEFNFSNMVETESFSAISGGTNSPDFSYLKNNLSVFDYDFDGKLDLIYTDGFSIPNNISLIHNSTVISKTIDLAADLSKVNVFPNPAFDKINIPLDDKFPNGIKYRIVSNTGQLINFGFTSNAVLNISNLASGNYHLLLQDNLIGSKLYHANFFKIQ